MDNLSDEQGQPPRRRGNPNMRKGAPSVNPRGAPRKAESLAQAVRDAVTPTDLAAKMLKLAESAESEQVRYQAIAWLAERGHGKVTSDYSLTLSQGEQHARFDFSAMSPDEMRDLMQRIDAIPRLGDGETEG